MNAVINENGWYGSFCIAVARIEAVLLSAIGKKGLGTAYALTGQILRKSPMCRAEISPGVWLRLPIFEPYWAPAAIGGRAYEPEIAGFLNRIAPVLSDWGFLDCGANFGYWSAFVSAANVGCTNVAAVELNPRTYPILKSTSALNGEFATFNAAISDRTGETVFVESEESHAVAHIGVGGIPVLTRTIDDIVGSLNWSKIDTLLIKLDVEGHEIQAYSGAILTRERIRNHALIYEDHGSDGDCQNTRFFLEAGYSIYFLRRNQTVVQLKHWSEAKALKPDPRLGYNLLAIIPGTMFESLISQIY